MSDRDRRDPSGRDYPDGPGDPRPRGEGRDLEIRLRLQVVGGEGDSPVQVRWVGASEEEGDPGSSGRAGGWWSRNARLVAAVGLVVVLIAIVALGASVLRPGVLADADEAPVSEFERIAPPTEPVAAGEAVEGGSVDPARPGDGSDPPVLAAGGGPVEGAGTDRPSTPEPAQLRITGSLPSTARIFVNGEEMRRRTLSLWPGSYDVEVRADGYRPTREEIRLRAGESRSWSPQIRPLALAQTPAPRSSPQERPAPVETRSPAPVAAAEDPEPAGEPVETAEPEPSVAAVDREAEQDRVRAAALQEVQGTLEQLVRALEDRDVRALRSIYPAMTSMEQDRWQQFLESEDISDLDVSLAYVQSPVVHGDLAEATFDLVLQFRTSYSGQVRQPTRYGATLERAEADWLIRMMEVIR